MSLPQNITTPLGYTTHNASTGSARAMQVRSANPLSALGYTDADKDKFIRPGHILQYNFRSSEMKGDEVCKADGLTTANQVLLAGIAITGSNVIPGEALAFNSQNKSWANPDWERVTYVLDGETYIRVDPKTANEIASGGGVELTEILDNAGDATYSNEYRFGTGAPAGDTDAENISIGTALEAQWNYIPRDPLDYDYNAGVGIPIVKVRLTLSTTLTTIG